MPLAADVLVFVVLVVEAVGVDVAPLVEVLSRMDVVVSTGVEEVFWLVDRLSRSSIHWTVWATALSALFTAGAGAAFKSACTVANAD